MSRTITIQNYFCFCETILESITIEKELDKWIFKSGLQRYVSFTIRAKFLVIIYSQRSLKPVLDVVSTCCFKKRVQR